MFIYLDDFADEIVPCDPDLDSWARWLARGGDEGWPVEVPADGTTFSASTLELTCWREYTRGEDGAWSPPAGEPEHDFAAIVDGEGCENWFVEDILSGTRVSEGIHDWMQNESDPDGGYDSVWVVFGNHNKTPLVATYHADGPRLTLAEKAAEGGAS
ncbi:hypothetical protein LL06_00890 [Hoeflea sp. BAL378]|uniref:hypothetical protein n=1 Tax=Hoeflea sp. BAL378 TaxID=1547437 RepID=UPI000513FC20|nr:hypothetical protein [Hoeflea sp. BAL378]KGF71180.1 hypothetical protein LL06_00890 [Hoeflea sp. BAL378]